MSLQLQNKIVVFLGYVYKQNPNTQLIWVYCLSKIKNVPEHRVSVFEILYHTKIQLSVLKSIINKGNQVLQTIPFEYNIFIEKEEIVYQKINSTDQQKPVRKKRSKEELIEARFQKYLPLINEVIDYFNECTGERYGYNIKTFNEAIIERASEGYTIDNFKHVIEVKCHQWLKNPVMVVNLKPSTLFSEKMDAYLLERIVIKPTKHQQNINAAAEAKSNLFPSTGSASDQD